MSAVSELNFLNPTLFSFDNDASHLMAFSKLNRQFILLLKRPLTQYLTSLEVANKPFGTLRQIQKLIRSALNLKFK